ncbi:MAG: helix-turn-helix transcriptional regulator [bacterium]|nr:helix-turn-helix transcriptional regulator [bacterium]
MLGTILKAAREHKGWTQQELAGHMRVKHPMIVRWELGKSGKQQYLPSPARLTRLCELLGIDERHAQLLWAQDMLIRKFGQAAFDDLVAQLHLADLLPRLLKQYQPPPITHTR